MLSLRTPHEQDHPPQPARDPPFRRRGEGHVHHRSRGQALHRCRGGAAVSCLGHGHPEVLAAMHAQIDTVAYAHTSFFTTEVAEALAETLVAHAPPGHRARVPRLRAGRRRWRPRSSSRASTSSRPGSPSARCSLPAARAITATRWARSPWAATMWRRKQFAPLLIDVGRVSPCYEYRDRRDDETPEQYSERLARELEAEIQRIGPGKVIAFVAETVVGATVGAVPPTPGYFLRIRGNLRPPRHPAHRRRGDVRHGAHRHAPRGRAGRHRARPDGHRQGPRRRLPADRRGARPGEDRRDLPRAAASSSTATPTSATRWPRRRRSPCSR